jgi:hypothetical protein
VPKLEPAAAAHSRQHHVNQKVGMMQWKGEKSMMHVIT